MWCTKIFNNLEWYREKRKLFTQISYDLAEVKFYDKFLFKSKDWCCMREEWYIEICMMIWRYDATVGRLQT